MNSLDALIDDPHLAQTGFFRRVEHPSEGTLNTMRPPARFSASPLSCEGHAPRFGEHSAEVLREAGYTDDEIAELAREGVTVLADEDAA